MMYYELMFEHYCSHSDVTVGWQPFVILYFCLESKANLPHQFLQNCGYTKRCVQFDVGAEKNANSDSLFSPSTKKFCLTLDPMMLTIIQILAIINPKKHNKVWLKSDEKYLSYNQKLLLIINRKWITLTFWITLILIHFVNNNRLKAMGNSFVAVSKLISIRRLDFWAKD